MGDSLFEMEVQRSSS